MFGWALTPHRSIALHETFFNNLILFFLDFVLVLLLFLFRLLFHHFYNLFFLFLFNLFHHWRFLYRQILSFKLYSLSSLLFGLLLKFFEIALSGLRIGRLIWRRWCWYAYCRRTRRGTRGATILLHIALPSLFSLLLLLLMFWSSRGLYYNIIRDSYLWQRWFGCVFLGHVCHRCRLFHFDRLTRWTRLAHRCWHLLRWGLALTLLILFTFLCFGLLLFITGQFWCILRLLLDFRRTIDLFYDFKCNYRLNNFLLLFTRSWVGLGRFVTFLGDIDILYLL